MAGRRRGDDAPHRNRAMRCCEAGFIAPLTEPIDPNRLEAEIQKLTTTIHPMQTPSP